MNFDIKKHQNDLIFIPLGGTGEIGMNVNLYSYQNKWIMVDLGAGFADEYYPGVDLVVAELAYINSLKDDLLGIIVTHAHEDHIGAIQYLWQELKCPIYATRFTANFLRIKLKDAGLLKDVKIIDLEINSKRNIGPFNIETIPLNHSAPEMQSLMIRTDVGNVFHTGDWKFDPNPIIGQENDEDKLKKIGEEGILALIGDSTNVFNEAPSGSEGALRESLINLIQSLKKLVVVTTFASNIARLDTLFKAGQISGRKIILSGKSLWRIYETAKLSGYFQDAPEVYRPDHIKNFKREELLIIATGCQGESLATVTKLANKTHPAIQLKPGDSIIFSSKIIPGNEKKIFKVFNNLIGQNINLYTERNHFVHVSGHPSKSELKRMYELVKPNCAIPVHGELMHLTEHAKLVHNWGIKNSLVISNGDVIQISGEVPKIIGKVESGYLGIDGHYLLPSNSEILKTRRKLRDSGVVFVVLIANKNNGLLVKPIIKAPGVLTKNEDQQIINVLQKEITQAFKECSNGKKNDKEFLNNSLRRVIKAVLLEEIGKTPLIDLEILNI